MGAIRGDIWHNQWCARSENFADRSTVHLLSYRGKLDLEMMRPRILDNSAIALAGLFFFFSAIVCALPQQKTQRQTNRFNGNQHFARTDDGFTWLAGP